MRYFPSAARQRLAVASVAGVVTLSLLASPFASPSATADGKSHGHDLKHQRHQVAGRITSASSDLDEASHALTKATAAVTAARSQLHVARAHLADVHLRLGAAQQKASRLRGELDDSKTRLATATRDLEAGQQAVTDERDQIRSNVVNTYTLGDPRLRAFGSLMGTSSLSDLSMGLTGEDIIVDRSNQAYDDLTAAETALATKQDAVQTATQNVADKTHDATRQVETVRGLYAEAATARRQVADRVTQNLHARQRAVKVRAHDRGVLKALRTRESRIKQQILDLAAKEKGGYTGSSNGFLDYPADGYPITSPYGYRVHPIYGYYSLHDGDDFGLPCGTQIHAAADGTIIDEYYDDVWGNRIILNLGRVNGHNMTVIYNHLSKFFSREGEHVKRGQVMGLSGTTGWSTGCHTHFTVMVDGVAVDPMKYL